MDCVKLRYNGANKGAEEQTRAKVEEALAYAVDRAKKELDPDGENADIWPDASNVRIDPSGNDGGVTLFMIFVGAFLTGVGTKLGEKTVETVWSYAETYLRRKYANEIEIKEKQ